jgi:ABC-type molybdate transport system substrate-binding protein
LHYGVTNNAVEAKAFFDFLFSAPSREILKKHGYALPST